MNIILSTIGRRGYIADYFRRHLNHTDRLIGTGNDRWTPGFIRCDSSVLLPSIDDDSYLQAVLDLCLDHAASGLVSFSDPDVHRLSTIREDLEALGVTAFIPTTEQSLVSFDKLATYEALTGSGFSVPETTIHLEEAKDWRPPLYVKPRYGSGSRGVCKIMSTAELVAAMEAPSEQMVAQRAIQGEHINVDLCWDLAGQLIRMCLWRRHRSRLGETELAETFSDSSMILEVMKLGAALAFRGPADIDLVRDDTGAVHVLDINPRFGGGYPVSHLAGIDIPGALVDILRGESVKPDLRYEPGVIMMKELRVVGGPRAAFATELGILA